MDKLLETFVLLYVLFFFLLTLIIQGNASVTFQSLTLVKYILYVKSQ